MYQLVAALKKTINTLGKWHFTADCAVLTGVKVIPLLESQKRAGTEWRDDIFLSLPNPMCSFVKKSITSTFFPPYMDHGRHHVSHSSLPMAFFIFQCGMVWT